MNATKCQVTAFTTSELLKEKQQGVELTPTQIKVKSITLEFYSQHVINIPKLSAIIILLFL